jgi:hypothetical protein
VRDLRSSEYFWARTQRAPAISVAMAGMMLNSHRQNRGLLKKRISPWGCGPRDELGLEKRMSGIIAYLATQT